MEIEDFKIKEHAPDCDCREHVDIHAENKPKDHVELFIAHINKLKPEYRKLARQAWFNQEGRCIFRDTFLKKSKVVVAFFTPEDPSKFEGLKVLPFLISDDLKRAPVNLLESSVIQFAYSLFGHELKPNVPKPLTPDVESAIVTIQNENNSETGSIDENG